MPPRSPKTYAIIGTGAIGGYCAVKLKQAGFDVHCLLKSDYECVKENGLTVIENNQSMTVPVHAYHDSKKIPPCDVILITLKSTANHILKDVLPPLLHKNTLVAVVQNGIGIEAELAEFIDPSKIVGASNLLKVTKTSPGVIKHYGFDIFEWAQYYADDNHKEISPAAQQLADDFKLAGFNSTPHPHLSTIKWKKLVANIPTSGLSVIFDMYTNELVNNPFSFALTQHMTKEVISVAKHCGADIPDDFYEFRMKAFDALRKFEKNNFSMKDDYDAGNKMELHAIYENAITIAKKHSITMPLTEMLYLQLQALEAKKINLI